MKFALKPLATLNGFVLAGLLATAGGSAMAQGAPATAPAAPTATTQAAPAPDRHHTMGQRDPAKMQAWMAKRQADMKAKLKITPAQEGAWTTYTAALKPPAHMGQRPMTEQRAEFDKLTTPERIDKMQALRTQRMTEMNAAMNQRGDATKTFYATLSPEQQKTFDAEHRKMGQRQGRAHSAGDMQLTH